MIAEAAALLLPHQTVQGILLRTFCRDLGLRRAGGDFNPDMKLVQDTVGASLEADEMLLQDVRLSFGVHWIVIQCPSHCFPQSICKDETVTCQ